MTLSPGCEQREERRHVRVGARVRLHVGVLGAEQVAGAGAGELLGLVDHEVAAVVALARVALGVLVREDGALRGHHRRRREVLRRDQLDGGVLTLDLAPDDLGDLGVGGGERVGNGTHARGYLSGGDCDRPSLPPAPVRPGVSGAGYGGAVRYGTCRPGACGGARMAGSARRGGRAQLEAGAHREVHQPDLTTGAHHLDVSFSARWS